MTKKKKERQGVPTITGQRNKKKVDVIKTDFH